MELVLQQRVLLAWLNAHLARHGHPTRTDLLFDLADGIALCQLVSSVAHTKIRGWKAHPSSDADREANVALALETAAALGFEEASVTPEDFTQLRTAAVVPWLWALHARFETTHTRAVAEQRLATLAGGGAAPSLEDVRDGPLLYRLIDARKPGLVNAANAQPGVETLDNAIFLLETHLSIPRMLDGTQWAALDERGLVVVVSLLADRLEAAPVPAAHLAVPTKPLARTSTSKARVAQPEDAAPSPPRTHAASPSPPRIQVASPQEPPSVPDIAREAREPQGGAYAKPAQSAAAKAKALKNRRSVNRTPSASAEDDP